MRRRLAWAIILSVLMMVPVLASCSQNAVVMTPPDPAVQQIAVTYPALSYTAAVEKVAAEGTWVAITASVDGRVITLNAGTPDFRNLVTRLEEAALTRKIPRYGEHNGSTIEATVSYPVAFTMEFALSDGSVMSFDYGAGQFWFNARDAIYAAATGQDLYDVLTMMYEQQD